MLTVSGSRAGTLIIDISDTLLSALIWMSPCLTKLHNQQNITWKDKIARILVLLFLFSIAHHLITSHVNVVISPVLGNYILLRGIDLHNNVMLYNSDRRLIYYLLLLICCFLTMLSSFAVPNSYFITYKIIFWQLFTICGGRKTKWTACFIWRSSVTFLATHQHSRGGLDFFVEEKGKIRFHACTWLAPVPTD